MAETEQKGLLLQYAEAIGQDPEHIQNRIALRGGHIIERGDYEQKELIVSTDSSKPECGVHVFVTEGGRPTVLSWDYINLLESTRGADIRLKESQLKQEILESKRDVLERLVNRYRDEAYPEHCKKAVAPPKEWSSIPLIGVYQPEGRWTIEKLISTMNGERIPANLFTGICLYGHHDTAETIQQMPTLNDYYQIKLLSLLRKYVAGDIVICIPDQEYQYASTNMPWISNKIPIEVTSALADRIERLAKGLIPDAKILRTSAYNNSIEQILGALKSADYDAGHDPYYPNLKLTPNQIQKEKDLRLRYSIETAMPCLNLRLVDDSTLPTLAILEPLEKGTVSQANNMLDLMLNNTRLREIYLGNDSTICAQVENSYTKNALEKWNQEKRTAENKWRATHGIWQVAVPRLMSPSGVLDMYDAMPEDKIMLNTSDPLYLKNKNRRNIETIARLLEPENKEDPLSVINHHIETGRCILNG